SLKLDDAGATLVASTCLAVSTPTAAATLLRYLETHDDNVTQYLQHAARCTDVALIPGVVRIGKQKAAADLDLQAQIIQSLAEGRAADVHLSQRRVCNPRKTELLVRGPQRPSSRTAERRQLHSPARREDARNPRRVTAAAERYGAAV